MLLILVRAKHTYFPVKKKQKKPQTWENSNSFLVKTATDRKQKFGKEIHTIEMCVTLLSENLIWLAFEYSYFTIDLETGHMCLSWGWTHKPNLPPHWLWTAVWIRKMVQRFYKTTISHPSKLRLPASMAFCRIISCLNQRLLGGSFLNIFRQQSKKLHCFQ